MRLILALLLSATLILTANCSDDDVITSQWLLQVLTNNGVQPEGTSECGRSNRDISQYGLNNAVQGLTSKYGEFPWVVALLKKTSSNVWSQNDYLGVGTLIHPSVVMTAAHNLVVFGKSYNATELKCRAGEWDIQTEMETYIHQEIGVAKFIKHEDYYRTSLYNDIVLLILERPFPTNTMPNIRIGCVASSAPPPGSVCYGTGWGRIDPVNTKKFATIMKKVRLTVHEHDTCQKMLRENSRLGNLFILHESLMCASGTTERDVCRGDSGAPLMCTISNDPNESRFAVYGMAAYGTKCFVPNVPRVYANLAFLKPWIDQQMQKEGLNTTFYAI